MNVRVLQLGLTYFQKWLQKYFEFLNLQIQFQPIFFSILHLFHFFLFRKNTHPNFEPLPYGQNIEKFLSEFCTLPRGVVDLLT